MNITPLTLTLALSLGCAGGSASFAQERPSAPPIEAADRSAGDVTASSETGDRATSKKKVDLDRMKAGAEARLERLRARLGEQVRAGELTRAQARERWTEAERAIQERLQEASPAAARMTRADYAAAEARMKKMVEAGDLTEQQMIQRLDRMKKAMVKTITQKEYDAAVARMTEMVTSGEMTREQMQKRLDRMKKAMAQPAPFTRADYAKAQADLRKLLDEGKITEAQMKQRLDRMRQRIAAQAAPARARFDEAVERLTAMVESGEITRTQMEQRLARMKQAEPAGAPRQVSGQDFAAAQARMRQMLADGEITEEQMNQRLNRMKEMMDNESKRDLRMQYRRMQQRLDAAVAEGKMTREAADQMPQEYRTRLGGNR